MIQVGNALATPDLATTQRAANQGDAVAQYNLAVMYDKGEHLPQNDAKAVHWYRKASEQGHAMAQTNLGIMYTTGQGVPKDYFIAAQWFQKAARSGVDRAQYNLGIMHYYGDGVVRDRQKGCTLLRASAEKGHRRGIEAYNKLCAG